MGLKRVQSIVTNTIKLKRVTDLFNNDSPEAENNRRTVPVPKRSSTLKVKHKTKDLTELDNSLSLDASLLNDSREAAKALTISKHASAGSRPVVNK